MYRGSSTRKQRRQRIIDEQVSGMSSSLDSLSLTETLADNITLVQQLFADVDILQLRELENKKESRQTFALFFSAGVVDRAFISEYIVMPLLTHEFSTDKGALAEYLTTQVLGACDTELTANVKDIVEAISYGDTVLFADGAAQAVVINTKSFDTRTVAEPDSERSLTGPREGFTESLVTNLSLLRRKVRTNDLKMKMRVMGRRTQTKVCVCYIDGLVNVEILKELERRLDGIDMDAVLDSNYLAEMMADTKLPLFRTTGYTERPDTVIGKILEGRIAILVDGSPTALTLPHLFIEFFQSSEDYYMNHYYTSFSRLLRILGFILTILVPGLYVAIVAFHHEMLPTQLLINLAAERASVPLPASLEALLMLLVFDLLRETGVRMPGNVGQALSIVGALVIGQAAVEARMVAAPMIIIVALTGICNLLVPKIGAPTIYVRLILLFLGSILGIYGLVLGASALLVHIINLRSFGVSVVTLTGDLSKQETRDTWVRDPWPTMWLRPRIAANRVRIKNGGKQP